MTIQAAQFEVLWSYKKWITGNSDLGGEIVSNIVMFVPFGFLLSESLSSAYSKPSYFSIRIWKRSVIVIIAALLFSASIETLQFVLVRGLFEWDDMINNTIGSLIGTGLFIFAERLRGKNIVNRTINILIIIGCVYFMCSGHCAVAAEVNNTSQEYCFQIDKVALNSPNELELTGVAFRYEHEPKGYSIVLRSTKNGKKVKTKTIYGISRKEVEQYFLCDFDYEHTSFSTSATGINASEEYEVMIKWPWMIPISTGVFVTGDHVHYVPENLFIAPKSGASLEEIVNNGILRVYRPDYHCWVYQMDHDLYWIADMEFDFEDDHTTYIQYQLWTTQTDRLPEKRIYDGHLWDNIGGCFEEYELAGDYGAYRVMKRELPTEYSITSIETGYYINGEWVWREYFRPFYEFK